MMLARCSLERCSSMLLSYAENIASSSAGPAIVKDANILAARLEAMDETPLDVSLILTYCRRPAHARSFIELDNQPAFSCHLQLLVSWQSGPVSDCCKCCIISSIACVHGLGLDGGAAGGTHGVRGAAAAGR